MILIKNVLVNNKRQDILIQDNIITKIGNISDKEIIKTYKNCTILSGEDKIALPGYINTHTHVPMTILRGVGDDIPLQEWLTKHIWPKEAKLTDEIIYWATLAGCLEMLKTGTTTFNDMYFFSDIMAQAVKDCGIRAFIGFSMIDLLDQTKAKSQIQKAQNYIDLITRLKIERINPSVAVHSPYTCSKKLLQEVHDLAESERLLLHIHINETQTEINKLLKLTGLRPVEYLNSIGFFKDVKVIGAHGVYLSYDEIQILKENNVSLAINLSSNLKLGSGIVNLPLLMKKGINLTLATDGAASNNNLNLHEEIKLASLLYKGLNKDSTLIKIKDINNFVYGNAAKALNLKAGTLKAGYLADLILIKLSQIELTPIDNIYSHLIYSFNGQVSDVIVDGRLVLKDGKSTFIDENLVISKVNELYKKLA